MDTVIGIKFEVRSLQVQSGGIRGVSVIESARTV